MIEILVPTLPESVADATLIKWHKNVGDFVNIDENLVDLETDKVVLEVPAPCSGILKEIKVADGGLVQGGHLLALIQAEESDNTAIKTADTPPPKTTKTSSPDIALSPSVRRLVAEKNIDASKITGTGKSQRITKSDVENYLHQTPNNPTKSTSSDIAPSITRPEQRVPMTRLRAKVAERLLQAQQNAAMLTTFNEVNMQSIMDLRSQYQTRFTDKHDVKLGFMSFFIKASIEALKRFPALNASVDKQDIIYHGYYDIGIAVSSPRGLVVPVLRDAEQLDFAQLEKSIREFGNKAKDGSLTYEDLSGGTFTITNGGTFGSMLSTPILNPPQCAILGMHAIKERVVVEKGEMVIRPIMYLALSYDHRLVDGSDAVQFLVAIKESLESPAHLLLNI